MILVQEILVSDDIVEQHFLCDLNACKGACCWEGDFGAPLEDEEIHTLQSIYPDIKHVLPEISRQVIAEEGVYSYSEEAGENGTSLLKSGACVFMIMENGRAKCGIEKAWELGLTDFRKPISCHLYPIRIDTSENFEAMNYDRWSICSAACKAGKKVKLPLYVFLKDAIIRKYGKAFYEELDAAAGYISGDD